MTVPALSLSLDRAIRFEANPRLTELSVGSLLASALDGVERPEYVILDLCKVRFITPTALVTLVALIERAHAERQAVQILCPEAHHVLSYLAAVGFFSHTIRHSEIVGDKGLCLRPPSLDAATVIPLTRIESNADVDRVFDDVRVRLERMAPDGDRRWLLRFRSLLVEICGNVFRHADVQVGYVSAQRYGTGADAFIELAIGDAGRGVIESLSKRHPDLLNVRPAEALTTAVRDGLSSSQDPHGGGGFGGLLKVARDRKGRFALHSSGAAIHTRRGSTSFYENGGRRPLVGTQVMVTVDCS